TFVLCLYSYHYHRHLHPFPTRRSSDLDIDSFHDLSEHRVTPVKVRGRGQRDEKLAAVGIRAGIGHRKHAFFVVLEAGNDLVGERSEEHTSELQSRGHLVCRLLLEKKKK